VTAAAATGATGRAAKVAGAGLAFICVAYRGTTILAINASIAKIMAERMRQAEPVYGISSHDPEWLANTSRRQADFGAR
jgi:hypothetical protein